MELEGAVYRVADSFMQWSAALFFLQFSCRNRPIQLLLHLLGITLMAFTLGMHIYLTHTYWWGNTSSGGLVLETIMYFSQVFTVTIGASYLRNHPSSRTAHSAEGEDWACFSSGPPGLPCYPNNEETKRARCSAALATSRTCTPWSRASRRGYSRIGEEEERPVDDGESDQAIGQGAHHQDGDEATAAIGCGSERVCLTEPERRTVVLRMAFACILGSGLVIACVAIDLAHERIFDERNIRAFHARISAIEKGLYWCYFAGVFWGMFCAVVLCSVFYGCTEWMVCTIQRAHNDLLKVRTYDLACQRHDRLLHDLEQLGSTMQTWFVIHNFMFVLLVLASVYEWLEAANRSDNQLFLLWASQLVSISIVLFKFFLPLTAASRVTRRWQLMVQAINQSLLLPLSGDDRQKLTIYMINCRGGFLSWFGMRVDGSFFFSIMVLLSGMFSLLRTLNTSFSDPVDEPPLVNMTASSLH